jgi:uncharacterized membrane protein YqjE
MADDPAGETARANPRSAIARLVDAALGLVHARAELATVEFAEERLRWTRAAILIAGGVMLLSFAILGLAAWIVAYFWDTYRLAAIAGVTLAFALGGIALLWRNAALWERSPAPFAQTLAEFRKDREWLSGDAGDRDGPT